MQAKAKNRVDHMRGYAGEYQSLQHFIDKMKADYGLGDSPLSAFIAWDTVISDMIKANALVVRHTLRGTVHVAFRDVQRLPLMSFAA